MENDLPQISTPPVNVDIDERLDSYDKELAETFPASDVPASVHP